MFDWIQHVPPVLEIIILLAAAIGAGIVIYKKVILPVWHFNKKINAGMDTLLGYPAVMDPSGSGKQLKAATPPMANRVDKLEDAFATMVQTQSDLASLQRDLADIQVQLQERHKYGDEIVQEYLDWRESLEADFKVWRAEQDELSKLIRENTQDLS